MANIWLHLGLGSFHRAHQEYAFNQLLEQGVTDWSFEAGNIRDDAEFTVHGLLKQNLHYTLETVSPEGKREFVTIKALSKVIPFTSGVPALIAEGALADTKVISFTVTEAGYYLDNNLKLMQEQEAIATDLKGGTATIYGVVAHILKARLAAGAGDVTLLCCDNVRENGQKFEQGLTEFLELTGQQDVLAYLKEHTSCPNTMVDRITPRPSQDLPAKIKQYTGADDCVPVMSESFFQWVIEDKFKTVRPPLEKAGVQMVDSVMAYEDAKLRILNASHTCLALLGVIKGYNFVFECARDPEIYQLAHDYVTQSVIPCIQGHGIDVEAYRDEVLNRFKNDHIRDTLQRIAQDSFSKLISFVQPTLLDCYRLGVDPKGVVLIPALYLNFLFMLKAGKIKFEYQDSSFDQSWADSVTSASDPVLAFANTKLLFAEVSGQDKFVSDLRERYAFVQAFK
ncbi:MAG: mannitol dehydrogenase family protein [Candidatus Anaerobiospirillum pullicola]|uniref:Mannitol dehydrogenase family protein n=1 Tax=Candidatus Anaerobiospirillum pullicola TaxID=2838451 RepID=A0A948WY72_9GAMM|nr:mannitol dehydrogenase family protein [Candidatus Anaerobiospirillum pullicola]